jgi:serine/threonine protein kinase
MAGSHRPSETQSASTPSHIGRFQIDGIYSQGGMSTIYLATDPLTHDQMVVKVLLPRFVSDPALVRQFINEGHIIAMTDHPNIVKLYEYGEWEGGVYTAMELVRGTSLRRTLQHNPLPLKTALEVLLQVCYAIGHLHSHGVIHGDLKPENILITDQNQVKVIDFGIAKVISEAGVPTHDKERFIGTPLYMSPEAQENPKNASIQSDIYSLGIIAYELVMGKITHGRVLLALAPRGMQTILQKALQPKPEDRYHDMNEFITEISEYIHSGNLQKDRQGIDYFFELFAQVEAQQKQLLTSLLPQTAPLVGATLSYGVGLNALYFRIFKHLGDTVVVAAKGERRGVLGIIDTYRLHTLFEDYLSDGSEIRAPTLIPNIFHKAQAQGVRFLYSALTISPSLGRFFWTQEGWGTLFLCTEERALEIISNGPYAPSDSFFLAGCASPTIMEFPSTPVVPLNIMLKEDIFASRHLPPQKQTDQLLQKLRLRGDCIVDDYPVCLISIRPTEGQ